VCVCVCVLLSAAADRKESRPALLYNSEREAKNRPGMFSTIWHRLLSPLSQRTTPTVHTHAPGAHSWGGTTKQLIVCESHEIDSTPFLKEHTHTHGTHAFTHCIFNVHTFHTVGMNVVLVHFFGYPQNSHRGFLFFGFF
jgi:hypothetical protein